MTCETVQMSSLNIISGPTNKRLDCADTISMCGYSSFHTPINLLPGAQAVTGIYDVSISDNHPEFYFIHFDIQGADDYLDCGGQIRTLHNAIMIPIPKKFFKPDENPRDLETVKTKIAMHGIDKAFRANQWRILSGATLIPSYSCSSDQLSADVSFFTTEPCCYSVHQKAGDMSVDTYFEYQKRETLCDYLSRMT